MKKCTAWFREHYDPDADMIHTFGTSRNVMGMNADGILPSYNFQHGQFEHAKEISGQFLVDTLLVDRATCYACPVACKRVVEIPALDVSRRYGGPEYETIAAGGCLCGIGDLKVISQFHQMCSQYVVDSISAGATIAFAMECFEKGLLTTADTDGIELRFGRADALLATLEKLVKREGVGDVLADGVKRAAERIGQGAAQFAMHVKGSELPMHEPRGKPALSLAYATAPVGADHMRGPHDPFYESFHPSGAHAMEPLGLCDPLPRLELSPRKVRAYFYVQHWWNLCNSLGLCHLAVAPNNAQSITHLVNVTRAMTGLDTSLWELLKVAERGAAMARVINCREGFTPADDQLPPRLHEAFAEGKLQGVRIEPETFRKAVRLYYRMEGWDPECGWPTFPKLAELGVEWGAKPGDGW